jgi:hypothetical protein
MMDALMAAYDRDASFILSQRFTIPYKARLFGGGAGSAMVGISYVSYGFEIKPVLKSSACLALVRLWRPLPMSYTALP